MAIHLDPPSISAVIEALCPQCTPSHPVEQLKCLESCHGGFDQRDLEQTRRRDEELDRIAALKALCLTSRWANGLATPHLYHRPVTMKWKLLARTLVLRPDLAARVRHLDTEKWDLPPVGLWDFDEYDEYDDYAELDGIPQEVQMFRAKQVLRSEQVIGGVAMRANDYNPHSSMINLMMALCRNLEELNCLIDGGGAFAFAEPGCLPRLRTFAASYDDLGDDTGLGVLTPLTTAAPNLTSLMLSQFQNPGDLPAPFTNLTYLHLDECTVSPARLRAALESLPRLKFLYFACYASDSVDPLEFHHAIAQAAPHLTDLHIDFDNAMDGVDWPTGGEWHHLNGSLAGLGKLERADLDAICILAQVHATSLAHGESSEYGLHVPDNGEQDEAPDLELHRTARTNMLPPSICNLRVRGVRSYQEPYRARLWLALADFAAVVSERLPRLTNVVVYGAEPEEVGAVELAFNKADVEFHMVDPVYEGFLINYD